MYLTITRKADILISAFIILGKAIARQMTIFNKKSVYIKLKDLKFLFNILVYNFYEKDTFNYYRANY